MSTETTDIVVRLRAPMWRVEPVDIQRVAQEAADEIERLRDVLRGIARHSDDLWAQDVARAEVADGR
jgi:hypothetical protein